MNIGICSEQHTQEELLVRLRESIYITKAGITVQYNKKPGYRSLDPVALQAIIALSSASIGALLKGLFDLAKDRITFTIKNGDTETHIEIPKNYNQKKLEELLQYLTNAHCARISIPKE
jgi:hypothetical protein